MKYYVNLNKKFKYVKVYRIVKRINENTNPISQKLASVLDRFFMKKKEG